jgi:hypothetical protein
MNAEKLLLAVLRGTSTPWPEPDEPETGREFLALSREHAVQPLIHHALQKAEIRRQWPSSVRDALGREAAIQAALEMCRQPELTRVLAALADAEVPVLLMKGGALAYTVYPLPELRPRCDTDLLLAREDLDRARPVLAQLGYAEAIGVTGELVSHQQMFVKHDHGHPSHTLDVHWQIVNPQRFAGALTFERLASESLPIPALGRGARTPGIVHSLLLACLHRFAHHYETDRLIWLYDIHLLGQFMSEADWAKALCLAEELRIAPVCGRCIQTVRERLGTALPAQIAAAFESATRHERTVVPERRWQILLSDLRALPSWASRVRLLAEHAFPAPEYILSKYPGKKPWMLPLLYARRALSGTWKLVQRVQAEHAASGSR